MRVTVFAVGTRMPAWVTGGVDEYARRMPRQAQFSVEEIVPGLRKGRGTAATAREQEADRLRKRAAGAAVTIALDERGRQWTSVQLAERLRGWLDTAPQVALLIGGADGLTDEIRDAADSVWSLSSLTLPHGLVRVVLAEQLYRAWTIIDGHPYHRGG